MWHGVDGMGWWMLWGGMMMVLFWGAIVALIVWSIQALTQRETGRLEIARPGSPGRSPTEIAKERYARGEISREEFEQIKEDLEER